MKGIWKKSANIFVCGLLGAAILVAGCGDSKTSAAVKEKPAVKTEQQLSAARRLWQLRKRLALLLWALRTRPMCVTSSTACS